MSILGNDRIIAEKITRKNMKEQPYWQGKNCEILNGEVATDSEFADAMKKVE